MASIQVLLQSAYRKNSKNWDTWNNYHNCPTIGTVGFYSAVLRSKDADRITNRVDTDQTAPWGAVWSGSALFAQPYLSQYFKLLRYVSLCWLIVNMACHRWNVLNTRSKMISKWYESACNIHFIEWAHFKYWIFKPPEVEHQTSVLVSLSNVQPLLAYKPHI